MCVCTENYRLERVHTIVELPLVNKKTCFSFSAKHLWFIYGSDVLRR